MELFFVAYVDELEWLLIQILRIGSIGFT